MLRHRAAAYRAENPSKYSVDWVTKLDFLLCASSITCCYSRVCVVNTSEDKLLLLLPSSVEEGNKKCFSFFDGSLRRDPPSQSYCTRQRNCRTTGGGGRRKNNTPSHGVYAALHVCKTLLHLLGIDISLI